jgi:hypothetical protein
MVNTRDMLKPKWMSPLKKSPTVSEIKVRSVMPVEFVKWSWKTWPPVSMSNPMAIELR